MLRDLPPAEIRNPDQERRAILAQFILESRKWSENRSLERLSRVHCLLESAVELNLVPGCEDPELLQY